LICEEGCHIYNYEQGAVAQLSGIATRTVPGKRSMMDPAVLDGFVRPVNEHAAQTRLVCLENTANRGGGAVLPVENVEAVCNWARSHGLATHLDGARLMNAVVKTGIAPNRWAAGFDTISVCFSKGLGAPVGSALVGSRDMLPAMTRHRKLFGGAMRQSGILAAAALYALDNNIDRLSDDHDNAQFIASAVAGNSNLVLEPEKIDTNIVIFRLDWPDADAGRFCSMARERGVSMLPFSNVHVRAVTHLHVSAAEAKQAGTIVAELADHMAAGAERKPQRQAVS
jgi:threonine aldolase